MREAHPAIRTLLALVFLALACDLLSLPTEESPSAPATLTPGPEYAIACTPPPCRADEVYYCAAECPGGCGTTCATAAADPRMLPLARVEGAGEWLLTGNDRLIFLDPSGTKPPFAFQRILYPGAAGVLTVQGRVLLLNDYGNGDLVVSEIYPRDRTLTTLEGARASPESMLQWRLPLIGRDGNSLLWSRADLQQASRQVLLQTSLLDGQTEELWSLELTPEQQGYYLMPLYYDEGSQTLIYALHQFVGGVTSASGDGFISLYTVNLGSGKVTPLVPLGETISFLVSAAISPATDQLAYFTAADFIEDSAVWQLHLRRISTGEEQRIALPAGLFDAGNPLFSPDGRELILAAASAESEAPGHWRYQILRLSLETRQFTPFYSAASLKNEPFFVVHAWTRGGWLILSDDLEGAVWVMRPDGSRLTKVSPFQWIGLIGD